MPGLYLCEGRFPHFFDFGDSREINLGRDPDCDLALPDPQVSRCHARIYSESLNQDQTRWIIRDQSRNGTRLNGRTVACEVLNPGDRLQIGRFILEFQKQNTLPALASQTQTAEDLQIVGESPLYQKVLERCAVAANCDFPVLILGETGSGKEKVAQLIAAARPPLVTVNCAALQSNLLESELFGYERGAFTGAQSRKIGLMESAQRGTLFLDEIGELPLDLQPKLLRVLEEKNFRRLGSTLETKMQCRILAATNRNLLQQVEMGLFREDLYHRLNLIEIHIPPLRQRREDILLLANYFLTKNGFMKEFSKDARQFFWAYGFPGNVRELHNMVLRAALLTQKNQIHAEDLQPLASVTTVPTSGLREIAAQTILKKLQENNWHREKTAQALGISRSTLFVKMRQLGFLNTPEPDPE